MPIPLKCECGNTLLAQDEDAGMRVKCPSCGRILVIASPGIQSGAGPQIDKSRETGADPVLDPLLDQLHSTDGRVWGAAMTSLSSTGEKAVVRLADKLSDPDWRVRARVVGVLGKIGVAKTVDPLIKALTDTHPTVRSTAVEALGDIGDKRAIEPIKPLLHDREEYIRHWSKRALQRLGYVPSETGPNADNFAVAMHADVEPVAENPFAGLGEACIGADVPNLSPSRREAISSEIAREKERLARAMDRQAALMLGYLAFCLVWAVAWLAIAGFAIDPRMDGLLAVAAFVAVAPFAGFRFFVNPPHVVRLKREIQRKETLLATSEQLARNLAYAERKKVASQQEAQAQVMTCPKCGAKLRLPAGLATFGRIVGTFKCGNCGAVSMQAISWEVSHTQPPRSIENW